MVGTTVAQRAIKAGVARGVLDRGGYKYHGRVKALAEGAREGGGWTFWTNWQPQQFWTGFGG